MIAWQNNKSFFISICNWYPHLQILLFELINQIALTVLKCIHKVILCFLGANFISFCKCWSLSLWDICTNKSDCSYWNESHSLFLRANFISFGKCWSLFLWDICTNKSDWSCWQMHTLFNILSLRHKVTASHNSTRMGQNPPTPT